MRGFLNKHIGGFCLFGIYNADIIHGFNLSVFALDLVRIKHKNKVALAVALIVAENVYQSVSCPVKTSFGKLFEVFPRKNNIVAVNKQILRAVIHGDFLYFSAALSIDETALT